jgi:hypothetical protein
MHGLAPALVINGILDDKRDFDRFACGRGRGRRTLLLAAAGKKSGSKGYHNHPHETTFDQCQFHIFLQKNE